MGESEDFEREVYLSSDLLRDRGRHQTLTRFRCVTPGIRVPRNDAVPSNPGDLAAGLLLLYPDAVLCGWTAARLYRHSMADSRTRIEVVGPRQIRRRGVISRTAALRPDEVVTRFGMRCTAPVRTAIDLARYVPGDEAIAAMDQMLRVHRKPHRPAIVTREQVLAELDAHEWWRGVRVRTVLDQADGRSESPWETFTRLALYRAGLRSFTPQVAVLGGTYRLDLADERYRVAVEYDGDDHRDKEQFAADVERRNVLQHDLGWKLIIVTAGPLMNRRDLLLTRVRTALADRGWDPDG